jgi:Zn-dependent protease
MSWRDRDEKDDTWRRMGRPGGDWQGIRPSFDNPMTWSVPLMRVLDIAVRVHVVFLVYIVIELARSIGTPDRATASPMDFSLTALHLGCLFGIVLLHEFGHCLACRRTGGTANEILMWPLGGLAYCQPVNHWRAHFVTAAGGPMVNLAICLVLGPVLGVLTGQWWGVAIPDPLHLVLPVLPDAAVPQPWWLLVLSFIHSTSWLLLLFNMLPIFPLDGGRLCQALLWPRFGYARSMRLAVYAGYFGAIALGIFGAVFHRWMLVAIAIFGGVTCYMTVKQLEWTESVMGTEESEFAASLWDTGDDEDDAAPASRATHRAERKAEKERVAAQAESAEVDRILGKIAEQGMDSLTRVERRMLKQATDRRRDGGTGEHPGRE